MRTNHSSIAFAFAPLAFATLALFASAAAEDEKTVTVTAKDDKGKVVLAKGDKLVVRLQSNPSTGYSWAVASKDDEKLKLQGKSEFERPKDNDSGKPVVGAPGTQVFTFAALVSGEWNLELEYRRAFEKDKTAGKTFQIKVMVK